MANIQIITTNTIALQINLELMKKSMKSYHQTDLG